MVSRGPGCSFGIPTRYGLDGPGSIPIKAILSAPVQTGPGAQPASYTMDTGSFPKVKRPRRGVTTHLQPALMLKKEQGYIPPLDLRGLL
jgi:hypothetical protein